MFIASLSHLFYISQECAKRPRRRSDGRTVAYSYTVPLRAFITLRVAPPFLSRRGQPHTPKRFCACAGRGTHHFQTYPLGRSYMIIPGRRAITRNILLHTNFQAFEIRTNHRGRRDHRVNLSLCPLSALWFFRTRRFKKFPNWRTQISTYVLRACLKI
ncbi:MAG: hypothetical protein MPEBLZ_02519 [Candidatus Methanoperedens nitroreducens]|uniref:Uncharacterized protein n=1 Tax=Candidatus Methanoperedens nitratireducens TaxID=1392998 RepID=A0A0N8KQS1_9EURY|nr:MAG: hypothetical protein MPEBLZ_02519 [Candidatus Methanoperedens sp. BLZ1]